MRLRWEREKDGVVTVTAVTSDGREAPVADFWLQPLISSLGASREHGRELQEQFAGLLVDTHNRHFSKSAGGFATRAPPASLDSTTPDEARVDKQQPSARPGSQ